MRTRCGVIPSRLAASLTEINWLDMILFTVRFLKPTRKACAKESAGWFAVEQNDYINRGIRTFFDQSSVLNALCFNLLTALRTLVTS